MNKTYIIKNVYTDMWLGCSGFWEDNVFNQNKLWYFDTHEDALDTLSTIYELGNNYQIIEMYYKY